MNSKRRFGTESSETRLALIDAAKRLMRAEGYSAVSSRRLAAFAGLKPQLVHYYFRTMDELFEAVFRRVAEQHLKFLQEVADEPDGLFKIWRLSSDGDLAVLTIEFMALANRHPGIRDLIAHYSLEYKTIVEPMIERTMRARGLDENVWPPAVMAVLLDNLPTILAISTRLGGTSDFKRAQDMIGSYLEKLGEEAASEISIAARETRASG